MTTIPVKWIRSSALVLLLGISASCKTIPVPVRQPGETVVYVVRHSEKVMVPLNAADPDLTARGRSRAIALAEELGKAGITRIVVTDLKRTQQTANPLATKLGITPEIVSVMLQGHSDSVAAAVLRHHGESILVVGHTNTVPQIIKALGGPPIPSICDNEYSDLYIVMIPESGATKLEHRNYGATDPDDRGCS